MASPERKTILCIHCGGPKPAAPFLERYWYEALAIGIARDRRAATAELERCDFRFLYYADLGRDLPGVEKVDEHLDVADRDAALARLRALDKSKRFRRVEYERLPGKSASREFLADIGAPVLRAIGLGRRFWRKLLPELGEYLEQGAYFEALNGRAVAALQSAAAGGAERLLVIAHGLGSVVAFHALTDLARTQPGTRVDTLITLGSPLADETIKKHLPGRDLASLVNWYNVAAEDDFLCHDETIANDFSHLLEKRHISRLEDYRIYNLAVRYGKGNPHHAAGYLVHPRVIQLVGDWLTDTRTTRSDTGEAD
jgi:hypothetical protein